MTTKPNKPEAQLLPCREIPLTQGRITIIDEGDWPLVSQFNWWLTGRNRHWYATTAIQREGRRTLLRLHRLLLNAPAHLQVDHKDGDGLNNRRSNIRLCTPAQNQHNVKVVRALSGYKGVKLGYVRWEATISNNGKRFYIGTYDTAEEAAKAYDKAAIELHGEFAYLNFPQGALNEQR